ncbi:MAG: IS66 family insertion sequence element accessory protein TnpB [Treponema sp.]|nr:IS66 family insertion sequence element accessory protein TnpB [Treponema sp.]
MSANPAYVRSIVTSPFGDYICKKCNVTMLDCLTGFKWIAAVCPIIGNEMKLDALCGSAFLFCNKTHKLLNVIFWDKTGFWQKIIFAVFLKKHHMPNQNPTGKKTSPMEHRNITVRTPR